jgi:prepilin-type N-terminal cleavage/methylation domain-containing protein
MERPAPAPASARTTRRGYTAVEVLMAMTVMAIGAAAVMSMQKASVQGNLDARKTDVANGIARTWIERLQRDAMQWTCPSPACQSSTNINLAKLLSAGSSNPSSRINGKWFLPLDYIGGGGTIAETMSPGFDILGRDLPQGQLANAEFCVNVRLSWLVPQTTTQPGLIRADVRVLWVRGVLAPQSNLTLPAGFCDTTTAALDDPDTVVAVNLRPYFHSLYLTTTITESPAQ